MISLRRQAIGNSWVERVARLQAMLAAPLASLFLVLAAIAATSLQTGHGYDFALTQVVYPATGDCGESSDFYAVLLPGSRALLNNEEMSRSRMQDRLERAYTTRSERALLLDADPELGVDEVMQAVGELHIRSENLHIAILSGEAYGSLEDPANLGCIRFPKFSGRYSRTSGTDAR